MRGAARVGVAAAIVIAAAGCGEATPAPVTPAAAPHASAAPVAAHAPTPGAQPGDDVPQLPSQAALDALRGREDADRATVQTSSFKLADLPRLVMPEPMSTSAPIALPSSIDPGDLVLRLDPQMPPGEHTFLVELDADGGLAQVRLGPWSGGIATGQPMRWVRCDAAAGAAPQIYPARWERVRKTPSGIEYTITEGWFDWSSCKVAMVRKTRVAAAPLTSDGSMVGFRVCGSFAGIATPPRAKGGFDPTVVDGTPKKSGSDPCADGESLVVVAPRSMSVAMSGVGGPATRDGGTFTRVVLPMRRGGGGSVQMRVSVPDLATFRQILGFKAAEPAGDGFRAQVLVGVEVSQAVDEPQPVGVAYVGASGAGGPQQPFGFLGEESEREESRRIQFVRIDGAAADPFSARR